MATYYKATDKNIQCRGYQFVPGQWHEIEGDEPLKLCKRGFHICKYPSGPWAYYNEPDTIIWEVEAEGILDETPQPGADWKLVCRRVRLVRQVAFSGHDNTGSRNTGSRNTGSRNTGSRNTGDGNAGDGNTGYWNTGDGNAGSWNTGSRNTGFRNTGDGNTGDGNATDYCTGFFCVEPQTVRCFDVDTGLTHEEFTTRFQLYTTLASQLLNDTPPQFDDWKCLPGATPEKLRALWEKHRVRRAGPGR